MSADEERLLAAIRTETDDDAPRLVYADWLLERGQPLGEFITLACADARGELGDEARQKMTSLLQEHERDWLGEVDGATVAGRRWTRGLPHRVTLAIEKDLRRAVGDPAWRRVQRLDALGSIDVEHATALIGNAVLRDLHELIVVDSVLESLVTADVMPDVARIAVFKGPQRGQASPSRFDSGKALADLLSSRMRLRSVYVNVAAEPAAFASVRRPDAVLGIGHALRSLREWQAAFDHDGVVLERVVLAGSHGFSRARNFEPLETTLRRDERGTWSVLDIRWGRHEDPAVEELLAGLEDVGDDVFTSITATGPRGHAAGWLPRLVAVAARQRRASLGGALH